jgi:hypothetical protein
VLWEEAKRGRWQGLTANYLRVYTRPDSVAEMTNKLLPTRLLGLQDEGLSGEPRSYRGEPELRGALTA